MTIYDLLVVALAGYVSLMVLLILAQAFKISKQSCPYCNTKPGLKKAIRMMTGLFKCPNCNEVVTKFHDIARLPERS